MQSEEAPPKRDARSCSAQHLLRNPDARNEYGENLLDTVVEEVIQGTNSEVSSVYGFDYSRFVARYGDLARQLERDGFTVEGGELRRGLPEELDLPEADDEVRSLLDRHGLAVPKGHLEQAIAAHTRGEWAAANSQLRAFVESLLDEIAAGLASPSDNLPQPGHQRRQLLSNLSPPFYGKDLNDWTNDGKGFLEGLFKRLHPQGSHPGLSDEDDSTFRLHLVLIVARLLLRRFDQRAGTQAP